MLSEWEILPPAVLISSSNLLDFSSLQLFTIVFVWGKISLTRNECAAWSFPVEVTLRALTAVGAITALLLTADICCIRAGHRYIRIAKSPMAPSLAFPYAIAAGGIYLTSLEAHDADGGGGTSILNESEFWRSAQRCCILSVAACVSKVAIAVACRIVDAQYVKPY
jgi:hypothetical protein